MAEIADKSAEMRTPGWLSFNLRNPTLLWRAATLNQPLIGAAYVAGGLGLAGYHLAPKIRKAFVRLVSPLMSKQDRSDLEDGDPRPGSEDDKSERRTWGTIMAALGALATIGLNYRGNQPDKGLFHYEPIDPIPKQASAPLGFPLGQCIDMINSNPDLEPYMKAQSLNLLNSFNAPPTQPVNGGNLVGQAIATGQSAATGLAVGWLTAKALGLPNPKSTAILGAVANTLGPWSALATSLAFGH